MARPRSDPVGRYLAKIDVRGPNECWPWTASTFHHGHGHFWDGEREVVASRFGWELHFGPIPDGMNVLHSCDVGGCQNPAHWFLGTQGDNMRDKTAKGRNGDCGPKTPKAGGLNGRAKLTAAQVAELRDLAGTMTQVALAARFGIGRTQVRRIINGESW